MLHMVVITNDVLQCSTCERIDWRFSDYVYNYDYVVCTFGHFSHVFTGETVDYFTFTYTFL